jgi:dTDP-glucose pyrophosphorylase
MADAIRTLEEGGAQICLVVDENRRLLGTVTDGDVRRGILRSLTLTAPVTEIMRSSPRFAYIGDPPERLLAMMEQAEIQQIPLVNSDRQVVGLITARELSKIAPARENWVVLMAGGLGNRLRPLTDDTPKPLLKVGSKPLLETIMETFRAQNFTHFFFSVNYKAEMVKAHFGDGSKWNCQIEYLEEKNRLGTAGALSLLPERPSAPMIVMNGDLLTKVNFASMVDFHQEQGGLATMGVREYDLQVPYGVVEISDGRIAALTEKPVHTFFVNAGIYVVDPAILNIIPKNKFFDMTDLFNHLIKDEKPTAVFPIREYWLDIGKPDDFARANGEFSDIFD